MSPEPHQPLNERVATIEPKVEDLRREVSELREFKDDMIKELAIMASTLKNLSWKISIVTGVVMVVVEQASQWGMNKLLK